MPNNLKDFTPAAQEIADMVKQQMLHRLLQDTPVDLTRKKAEPAWRDPDVLAAEADAKQRKVDQAFPTWLRALGVGLDLLPAASAANPKAPTRTASGAVRSRQLVGQKKYLDMFNEFLQMTSKELDKVRLGGGAQGTAYRMPGSDVVIKLPVESSYQTTSQDRLRNWEGKQKPAAPNDSFSLLAEALALMRLRQTPEINTKGYLGSVAMPLRDLKNVNEYSDLVQHVLKGTVDPTNVGKNPVLFTKFVPTQEQSLRDVGLSRSDIARIVAAFERVGIHPMDLGHGNTVFQPTEKGTAEPLFLDLGMVSEFSRPTPAKRWARDSRRELKVELENSFFDAIKSAPGGITYRHEPTKEKPKLNVPASVIKSFLNSLEK